MSCRPETKFIEASNAGEACNLSAKDESSSRQVLTAWRTFLAWGCIVVVLRFGGGSLQRLRSSFSDADRNRLQSLSFQVDVNLATAAELQTLEGIGPSLANRIVGYRNEHGPFRSLAELEHVSGFGEKRIQQLSSKLVVNTQP